MSTPASDSSSSGRRDYRVRSEVELSITVNNPDAIERVTGAGGDEWRSLFYQLHTVEDVLGHWTYNALCNGVRDVSRLEGWADLDATAVTFELEYNDAALEVGQ